MIARLMRVMGVFKDGTSNLSSHVIKMLMMPITFVCSRPSRGEWFSRSQTLAMKKNENPLN